MKHHVNYYAHGGVAFWYVTVIDGRYQYTDAFVREPTGEDILRLYASMVARLDKTTPGWRECA